MDKPIYKRVLLKLSGEVLMGDSSDTINPAVMDRLVREIAQIHSLGVEIGIVIGGGNFFRGAALAQAGITRVTGDYMGMLATIMNAFALRDAFDRALVPAWVLSAIPMSGVADHFNRHKAIAHLEQGKIVIFAGGTGNPLVTTDSASSLRGIEIAADVILKATNVDGVYSSDPKKNPDAVLFKQVSYAQALEQELAIMDLAAFAQCRDYNMKVRVFNIKTPGSLFRVITSYEEGTQVGHEPLFSKESHD